MIAGLVVGLLVVTTASAATINVPADQPTIQVAVDAASDGDTINIAAGTYVEQVVIDSKNLTLVGEGSGTIIQSPDNLTTSFTTSAANYPIVFVTNADNVAIKDLVVDGAGKGNANYRFLGIGYYNAGGLVENVELINVMDTPFSGAQHGTAMYLYNDDTTARLMTVRGCDVHDYQKTAIALNVGASTPLSVLVENNVVTGAGPTTVTAQNGIQVWGDTLSGTIQNNSVSGNYYSGANWGASGILSYFGGALDILNNTLTDNQMCAIYGSDGSLIQGNTITGGQWSLVLWQSDDITIQNNVITGGSSSGLDLEEVTNITVLNNDLSNNADAGLIVWDDSVVNAINNWWGAVDGPSGDGPGSGSAVFGSGVGYDPWLGKPIQADALMLLATEASLYVKPTETALINLDVFNLAQPVVGCQAMLSFSSTYFGTGNASIVAGGGVWDWLIYSMTTVDGDLDVAVGVDLEVPGGTQGDGTVAKLTLTPTGTEGITHVVFRADVPDDDTQQTFFSDALGGLVMPGAKIDSQSIVIDGTAPTISITSAAQGGNELIGTSTNALRGDVTITVAAADALAGLAGAPTVIVGGNDVTSTAVDNGDGTFTYTFAVTDLTPNGATTIEATAEDKAGNTAVDSASFNVNKNEIVANVATDTLSSVAYSFNRDVTFVAMDGAGSPLASWTKTVDFANDAEIASGSATLQDVPSDTVAITADTDWTLVQKIEGITIVDGSATVDFTGAEILRVGDINGSNSINVLDYALLKMYWYTADPTADLNSDGEVQLLDYNLLKQYWFQRGE